MPREEHFGAIFDRLKRILQKYERRLIVKQDSPGGYSLDAPYSEKWKKELFFGAVQIKKNYVSYYLMPVYMFPDLLDSISPELKRRMQGKSCFNFTSVNEALFKELAELTKKGFERCRQERLVSSSQSANATKARR